MKYLLTFLLTVYICGMSFSAQLRESVFIVRPSYSTAMLSFTKKTAASLQRDGYFDFSKSLENFQEGGFGSGFLYVAKDGKNYIVTNRHVISWADEVTITQEAADGSTKNWEHCKVIYVGDELDLALVSFPEGTHPFKEGLALAEGQPSDGEEVWTAGYPGLGNMPSWQLGKGTITNAALKFEELVHTSLSTIIQHSAQVDPGSSGGPLLQKTGTGYTVLGINTWKASSRQDVNFAIPAGAIKRFLVKALAKNQDGMTTRIDALNTRLLDFVAATSISDKDESARMKRIAHFISLDYIHRFGESAMRQAIQGGAKGENRKLIIAAIMEGYPLDGFRLALAWQITEALKQGETAFPLDGGTPIHELSLDGPTASDSVGNGKAFRYYWIEEVGNWRLFSTESVTSVEKKETVTGAGAAVSLGIKNPCNGSLFVERSNDFGDYTTYTAGLDVALSDFFAVALAPGLTYNDQEGLYAIDFAVQARIQVPVRVTSFLHIVPYLGGKSGMLFCSEGMGTYGTGNLMAGTDIYLSNDSFGIVRIGANIAKCGYTTLMTDLDGNSCPHPDKYQLGITLGLGF